MAIVTTANVRRHAVSIRAIVTLLLLLVSCTKPFVIDSGEYVAQNEFFLERTLHSSCHRRPTATVLGQKMRTGRGVMPKGLLLLSDGWDDRKPSKYIFILTIKIIKNQSETVNRSSKDAFVQLATSSSSSLCARYS